MKTLSSPSFPDNRALITFDGKQLILTNSAGTQVATALPSEARRLSEFAFASGANSVVHSYDLKIAE